MLTASLSPDRLGEMNWLSTDVFDWRILHDERHAADIRLPHAA